MSAVAQQIISYDRTGGIGATGQTMFCVMKNGTRVQIRPICPDDEKRMVSFHKQLSERSVYMRYFESLSLAARTAHTRLARICFTDATWETVLVALRLDEQSREQEIVAVGRLSKLSDQSKAEVALLVLDEFRGLGLGSELLRHLIQAAREQKVLHIQAEMLRDNTAIQRVLRKFGFHFRLIDPRSVRAVLNL